MVAMVMLAIALLVGVVGIMLCIASWAVVLLGMTAEQYVKNHAGHHHPLHGSV